MAFDTFLNRAPLVNVIIDRIKTALLEGELKPGDKLPSEIEFSNSLGVGRGSIREAFKMLKALGVVEVKRGDGTYIVDSINEDSINPLIFSLLLHSGTTKDLLELRRFIEKGCLEIVINKADEEDLLEIENAFKRYQQAVISKEYDKLGELDIAFHITVIKATKNAYLIKLGTTVIEMFSTSIKKISKINPTESGENHRKIYELIKNRDLKSIDDVISFHLWENSL